MNAVEIEQAVSELAEAPFDAAEFPYAFLAAFGNKETTLKRLRSGATNKSDVAGAVLQWNNIHLAVCEPGRVGATLTALRKSPASVTQKVKTSFQYPRNRALALWVLIGHDRVRQGGQTHGKAAGER